MEHWGVLFQYWGSEGAAELELQSPLFVCLLRRYIFAEDGFGAQAAIWKTELRGDAPSGGARGREKKKKNPLKSHRSLVAIGTCQTEQIEFVFLRWLVGALNSVLVALLIEAVKTNLFGCEPGRLKRAMGSALTRRAKSCQRRHPVIFTTTPHPSSRRYLLGINYSELRA